MKTIKVNVDICDCGCQHCEFNARNTTFCTTCPYKNCDASETRDLEVEDGDTQIVECSYCDREYGCKISFSHV